MKILQKVFALVVWRMSRTILPYFWGESGEFWTSGLGADKMEEENEKIHFIKASCVHQWCKELIALKTNRPI